MCIRDSLGGVYAGVRAAGSDVERMYFIWGADGEPQHPALTAFLKFWSFVIIFTNFVPISLLVTLDMVKMFQSKIIGWDRQMYHEAREFDGTKRPMPAQVPPPPPRARVEAIDRIGPPSDGNVGGRSDLSPAVSSRSSKLDSSPTRQGLDG